MPDLTNNIQGFSVELDFEKALASLLTEHGWEEEIIMNPTEEQLIDNWAKIIYDNNRDINRLGNWPLTSSEMNQIITKVNACTKPYEVNKFINAETVCIMRDNEQDTNNYGKEVYLKLFDAKEICSGQSRYQIVRQPRFRTADPMRGNRRGDIMLLINGMPVIHIELKRSMVDVSQATFQLKRYAHEGIFSNGIFSMVQVFVAMTPEETLYFANPGEEANFSPQFYFHWEDFNNNVVSDWKQVTRDLLSIPMAHQLVGFYTIADDKDQTLKVLRSYQYFAVSKISDRVRQTNWDNHQQKGGFVWHTTGSGKTMTSFKSAQLIANSGDADKVVFMLDRIELSTQSLDEFRGFADDTEEVQDTADTTILLSKLKSTYNDDKLIVTSIQKMYRIRASRGIAQSLIDEIGKKRLVFIIDECHRSVFGEMLISIKHTFHHALFFGFTGTPVFEENAMNEIMTETLFGDMLCKYTIASGIPDKNVLGFDPYMVNTFDEEDLRDRAARHYLGIDSVAEIEDDEEKSQTYKSFMHELRMIDSYEENGEKKHGIEHYLPKKLYQTDIHHQAVAKDIVDSRQTLSKSGKFHAILATKNIPEAIAYYKIFKEQYPSLNVVAIFDNNIDNSDEGIAKEDSIIEMLTDYNSKYGTTFMLANYLRYKKDVAKRLAHKKPYHLIDHDHSQQIDLLIVVTQMLTGYDSKWVNTLYVDKVMKYVDVIQAFSRTNRLFGPDKPFGIIKYYAFPYTMEQNINDALEVYVDRPLGVFVDKLEQNLTNINTKFLHIRDIFFSHEIFNFEKLPDTREDRNMFAQDFSQMTHLLEEAKLQGFLWEKAEYEFQHGDTFTNVTMQMDEQTYLTLLQRYRELFERTSDPTDSTDEFDYPVDTFITETGTGTIDAEYINSKFEKFVKNLYLEGSQGEVTKAALKELHKAFATLSRKDQRTALIVLHDIQSGDLHLEVGKTIYDYIAEYQIRELHKQIMIVCEATGINPSMLMSIMSADVNEQNLNEFNRFEDLKHTVNLQKAKVFVEKVKGIDIRPRMVMPLLDSLLRLFILSSEQRNLILKAYLNEGITLDNAQPDEEETPEVITDEQSQEEVIPQPMDIDVVKENIKTVISLYLADLSRYMRPMDDVVESVFLVLQATSLPSLDSVGLYIDKAFRSLYLNQPTLVDKFVSFNLLVTKFEAYLKKLYYLMKGEEVKPQFEGNDVSWKDVIYNVKPLWRLKFREEPEYQQLFNYLNLIKGWRNSESHISPTASEQEVNTAIGIIMSMYFYATGSCITDLEMAGYYSYEYNLSSKVIPLHPLDDVNEMAAEQFIDAKNLTEKQRADVLQQSLIQLMNHGGYVSSNKTFCKQRHWVSVYRIAVDEGFIENDYEKFQKRIDEMNLQNCSVPLNIVTLKQTLKDVYATPFKEWKSEGVSDRKLSEYNDIKHCADVFIQILSKNRPKK